MKEKFTWTSVPNAMEILRRKAKISVLDIMSTRNKTLREANTDVASILRNNFGEDEAANFPSAYSMKSQANRKRRLVGS